MHKSFCLFLRVINLQVLAAYTEHLLKATTRHGLHSPFVYRLTDEVIYGKTPRQVYTEIEDLRKELLKDKRVIRITDLGAGSHVNNNRKKQVKQLAKNALKPPRLAQLIYRLANDLKPRNITELGTCLGITTTYLARAVPSGRVISVEGCPQTAAIAEENLKKLHIQNVEILTGNFDTVLPGIISREKTLDFVYIDGNHRRDATLAYFELCLPAMHENSLMIFDDIYWSRGMKEAWQTIKAHPRVTVSIDLFWIGLVFFKKDQAKEHFRIRI